MLYFFVLIVLLLSSANTAISLFFNAVSALCCGCYFSWRSGVKQVKLLWHVVFLALGCEVWLFYHLGLIRLIKRIWFHFEVFAIFWKAGVLINNCCSNWGLNICWFGDQFVKKFDWILWLLLGIELVCCLEQIWKGWKVFFFFFSIWWTWFWRQYLDFVATGRSWTCLFKQFEFLNWKFQLLCYLDCCLLWIWWGEIWAIQLSLIVIVNN